MEKSKLEKFITKYNLGGSCESVILNSDGDSLTVRAITKDKNLIVAISAEKLNLPEGRFAVYETKKLKSMLSVLDENIAVKTNTKNSKITGLDMTDGTTKLTFALADPSVVSPEPDTKKLPPTDVIITLDEKFINTFIRAKSALNEIEIFTITSKGTDNTASIIIGKSLNNTNRIELTVNTDKTAKLEPISFSANYLREILNANKDMTSGALEVSAKGISTVKFTSNGVTATYYLIQKDI